jgi:hypothetical protein
MLGTESNKKNNISGLKCEVSDNEKKRKIKRLAAYGNSISSKGPGVCTC